MGQYVGQIALLGQRGNAALRSNRVADASDRGVDHRVTGAAGARQAQPRRAHAHLTDASRRQERDLDTPQAPAPGGQPRSPRGVSRAIRCGLSVSTAMVSVRYIVRSLRNSDDTGSTEGRIVAEKILNLRGLKCPLPALRVRKALTGLKTGDMLIAECTDPLTAIDIPNLLRETGDTMVSTGREGEVLIFRIRKS